MIWGDFTHYFRKHPYFRRSWRGMAFLFALKSCKPIKLSNDLEIWLLNVYEQKAKGSEIAKDQRHNGMGFPGQTWTKHLHPTKTMHIHAYSTFRSHNCLKHCWWQTEIPVNSPVEVGSLSHYLQGFIHSRWLGMGFLNHQQYGQQHIYNL